MRGFEEEFLTTFYYRGQRPEEPVLLELAPGEHRLELMLPIYACPIVTLSFVVEAGKTYRIEHEETAHSREVLLLRELASDRVVLDTEPTLDEATSADVAGLALQPRAWYRDYDYSLVVYDEAGGGEVLDQFYPTPDGCAAFETLPASADLVHHVTKERRLVEASILECSEDRAVVQWYRGKGPQAGVSILRPGQGGLHVLTFRRSGSALSPEEVERWSRELGRVSLRPARGAAQ